MEPKQFAVASTDADGATASAKPARPTAIVCTLWFEQFKQVIWLGATSAGGVLILLQAELLPSSRRSGVAVALCALSAVVAVVGQIRLVEAATRGGPLGRDLRTCLYGAIALFAAGAGLVLGMLA